MEELINYINEMLETYQSYFKANTEEQNNLSKEMILEPDVEDGLSEEAIKKNEENTEKLFYLLMNENQLKGAIIAAENIKTFVELPKHAETVN